MEQSPELVFKEGDLSPGVYSFAQMKGVTSTTLVDFSCRFTWSVTNFQGKKNEDNINPEMKCISPQHPLPIMPRGQLVPPGYNHVYNHDYPYPPLSSPLSAPISSPQSSQMAIPPPHMQFTKYDCGYNMYPRAHVTPKTFSPVLIYQRPTFTSGNVTLGRYGNGFDSHQPHGFVQDRNGYPFSGFKHEDPTDGCKLSCNPETSGNRWNQCVSGLKQQSHPWMTYDIPINQRDFTQEGTTNSAFQAWKPEDSRRNFTFHEIPSPDAKPHIHQNSYTDSAKLKFFLDTKYGLADAPEFPVSPDSEVGFRSDLGSSLGSDFSLETNFSDPFLDMLHDPLLPLQLDESDESKRARKYKCPYCNVSCANNGQLKGHLRVHTGEKPYRCEFGDCGRAFARNEELTRHRRIHSGIRPHTCNTCGKKFGRKDHLNKHQKTHLKTAEKKVHVCNVPGCEQRYTRSDALARHQWGSHGIKSKSPKWRTQIRDNLEVVT